MKKDKATTGGGRVPQKGPFIEKKEYSPLTEMGGGGEQKRQNRILGEIEWRVRGGVLVKSSHTPNKRRGGGKD